MPKTFADMTPEDRAKCEGVWVDYQTPCGTERAIFSPTRWSKVETLFAPGYGLFEVEDLSRITQRPDLPRAWTPDGTPPKGEWEEGGYFDFTPGASPLPIQGRRWISEWEPVP